MATHAHYAGEFGYKPRIKKGKIAKIEKIKATQAKLDTKLGAAKMKHAKTSASSQKKYAKLTSSQKLATKKAEAAKAKIALHRKKFDTKMSSIQAKQAKLDKKPNALKQKKLDAAKLKAKATLDKKMAMHGKKVQTNVTKGDKLQAKKLALRAKMNKAQEKLAKKESEIAAKSEKLQGKVKLKSKSDVDAQIKELKAQKTALVKKSGYGKHTDEIDAKISELKGAKSSSKSDIGTQKKAEAMTTPAEMKAIKAQQKKSDDEWAASAAKSKADSLKSKSDIDAAHKEKLKTHDYDAENDRYIPKDTSGKGRLSDAEYRGHASTFLNKATPEQRAAIKDYTFQGDGDVNAYLRGNAKYPPRDPSRLKPEHIKKLDDAIATSPVPRDTTAYRGVHGDMGKKLVSMKPGESFTDKGFVSTSQHESVATTFSQNGGPPAVVMRISIAQGQKAAAIAPVSKFAAEKELLLPRGTKFTVTKIEKADGKHGADTIVHVTIDDGGN